MDRPTPQVGKVDVRTIIEMRDLPTALTVIKYIAQSRGILKGGDGYLTKYKIIELCEKWLAAQREKANG